MEGVPASLQNVDFSWEDGTEVFRDLSLDLPPGPLISLLGPNGSGKSTLLYLLTGRVLPTRGRVLLFGHDTATLPESERNRLASMLYQNMEFDHDEPLGQLLEMVEEAGSLAGRGLRREIIQALELGALLSRPAPRLSKGEMQRAVLAFCLLFGSRLMALDEPVFALEDRHKRLCMGFVREFARAHGFTVVASLHELELSKDYFDDLVFVPPGGPLRVGPTAELFRAELLEQLFQAPWAILKQREAFYREGLRHWHLHQRSRPVPSGGEVHGS